MTTEAPAAPPAPAPDTAPPPAAPVGARPPAAPDPALGGLSPAEVRRNAFVKAFERETTPELAEPATPKSENKAAPKATVDTPTKKADTEGQAPTPAVEAAANATASTEAPAAAPPPEPASPLSGTTPPATTATPAKEPSAAAVPKSAIPQEFQTPEHEAVYKADPLAKREVARIWGDPNRTDVEKALSANKAILKAEARISDRAQSQANRLALREQGNFEELGRLHAAELDEKALTTESEAVVTRLLALAAGTTPDDEGFLGAGSDATTDEERYAAWGRWFAKDSPVGRDIIASEVATAEQRKDAEIADLKAQFAEERKTLEATFKDTLATEVEKAMGQARAGNPPPRANVQMPQVGEYVRPQAPTLQNARELMAAGIAARDEASGR